MTEVAIRTEGLVRHFGEYVAVDGVDLDIARGEIYGFLGPNGAGKSTTVRVLCTLLAPTAGRATVAGYDVGSQPGDVRLRIGVALQDAALDPKQTGRELLRLQGLLYGLPKEAMSKRVDELGELIDLTDALDRPIATYSGGMKRRLDLVAALVHNPEVLFLDEPTTGLDPASRTSVWDEVRRLNAGLGMTIFLTTQYLEEADELCGRVGIINQGRIVAEGTPDDLKREVGADIIIARVDGDAAPLCRGRRSAAGGAERRGARQRAGHRHRQRFRHDQPRRGRPRRLPGHGPRPHPAHPHPRRRVPRADRYPHRTQRRPTRRPTDEHRRRHRPCREGRRPPRPAGGLPARRHRHRRPRAAGRAPRHPGRGPAGVHRAVLLHRQRRHPVQAHAGSGPGFDYKAFQMPTAILLGVTGVSRAPALVLDVQDGYLDRLLMTPIRRLAILLGHMVADVAVAVGLTVPILALGFAIGVRFETGVLGVLAFVTIAALWSVAFSGFGYAIALKTGNPAAVNSTFLLFFPFLFLTSS